MEAVFDSSILLFWSHYYHVADGKCSFMMRIKLFSISFT